MADARIIIEGRVASDPRIGTTPNGVPVANLRVLAGRSRKDEQGNWQTLSTTAYDVSFWQEHAELASSLNPQKGDSVVVSGTVTGLESYQGQQGESLSAKVSGDGLRVFKKQTQQGGQQGGYQGQPQQAQQGWGQQQAPQDPWGSQPPANPPF